MKVRKRAVLSLVLTFIVVAAVAAQSDDSETDRFAFVFGPRIGVSWRFITADEFSAEVRDYFGEGSYFPVISLFGALAEQRFLLGETTSHFVIQEVVFIAALEQSIALPSGAVLIGYRSSTGFEFGVGPTFSFAGMGVVVAAGWTFSYKGVFIPVDINWIIPNQRTLGGIGVTTGFNFRID